MAKTQTIKESPRAMFTTMIFLLTGSKVACSLARIAPLRRVVHWAIPALLAGFQCVGCRSADGPTASRDHRLAVVRGWHGAASLASLDPAEWKAFATDDDQSIRKEAVLLAPRMHMLPVECLSTLTHLTADPADAVRSATKYVLGDIPLPAPPPSELASLLDDTQVEVRLTVLELLARSEVVSACFVARLTALLADPAPIIRELAERNLVRADNIRGDEILAVIALLEHDYGVVRERAREILSAAAPPGLAQVDDLCALLTRQSWAIRGATAKMIGLACRDSDVRQAVLNQLRHLLEYADPSVDYGVAWSISAIGRDDHSWQMLTRLLEDGRYVESIGSARLHSSAQQDSMRNQLIDDTPTAPTTPTDVHRIALEALEDSAPGDAEAVLIPLAAKALSDSNFYVRSAAASLLASLGDEGKFELLGALRRRKELIRFVSDFGPWQAGGLELYEELQRFWAEELLEFDRRKDMEIQLGTLIDVSDPVRQAVIVDLSAGDSKRSDFAIRGLARAHAVSPCVVGQVEATFVDSSKGLAEPCLQFFGRHGFSRQTAVAILKVLDADDPILDASSAFIDQFDANATFLVDSYPILSSRAQRHVQGILCSGLSRTTKADIELAVADQLGQLLDASSKGYTNREVLRALTVWVRRSKVDCDKSSWAKAAMSIVESASDDRARLDAAAFLGELGAYSELVTDRMRAVVDANRTAAALVNILYRSMEAIESARQAR